ncbi:MAG: hypothetical protein GX774_05500 [Armatimonadetes bacterium]|nr:hypothetical protein [Armatimonadota bacterium]
MPSLILLLTAILQLLVGSYVFRHNPRGPVHRAVFLETALIALWALFIGRTWLVSTKEEVILCGRLAHATSLFCCTGFVNLCLIYPEGRSTTPVHLRAALWLTGGLLALGSVLTPGLIRDAEVKDLQLTAVYGNLRYAYFGYLGMCILWGLTDVGLRFGRLRGMSRGQMEYLLVGLALTGLLNVPSNMVAPLLGMSDAVWMGPCFSLVFLGFITHAIIRHRLMGIQFFVAGWSVNLLAVVITTAAFFLVLHFLGYLGHSVSGGAALAVALLFQPLRTLLHRAVAHYFYRPEYDYQTTVRDASRALAATLDLGSAVDHLLGIVSRTLQVEHALVLVSDPAAGSYRMCAWRTAWVGPEEISHETIGIPSDSPLVTRLEATRDVIVREELEYSSEGDAVAELIAQMAHFRADVAVPLFSGNLLRAILLVGPKVSGDYFTVQDIDLLSTLGAEAAGAVANAQLHQDAIQAERLATLGGLAAGIAHEVKNPLVAVRTFAELLPEKYEDPEFREGFSVLVVREVDRIDRLIGQLLSYARPAPPRLEILNLNTVVEDTLRLLNYEFERHAIRVEMLLAPDLPPVRADVQQMQQVVLNIALNASQVMPDGGLLRVTTRGVGGRAEDRGVPYLLQAERMAEIELANTGPRIPEANLERIFEPFYTTRSEGTGLGLSICKQIVTGHHGQIHAAVTDDGLMAFIVGLPAAAPQAEATPSETLAGVSGRSLADRRNVGVV